MRLLVSWVRDFVEVTAAPEEIADRLGLRGFEVASVEPLGGNDGVIDLEVTANRPDCLSVQGFAREISVIYDLPLRELIGAYAGEIGQTQFLPSSYIKYGVDYDGNGHVDLRHSVPDVLASTANLLKANGWRPGAPFGEGTPNFEVMREWNRSVVYRQTMALFAERLTTP